MINARGRTCALPAFSARRTTQFLQPGKGPLYDRTHVIGKLIGGEILVFIGKDRRMHDDPHGAGVNALHKGTLTRWNNPGSAVDPDRLHHLYLGDQGEAA